MLVAVSASDEFKGEIGNCSQLKLKYGIPEEASRLFRTFLFGKHNLKF